MKKNILFTTGGTGGHIYPAISIAKEMKKEGHNIIFVGTDKRMEKEIVPNNGFDFIGLDIIPLRSIKSIYKLILGINKARKIIKENNIDAIFSFGNYISLPSAIAGIITRTPIYIQEQNIDFGMANKLLKNFSKKIFLAFAKTKEKYKLKGDVIISGNPLREEFYNHNIEEENAILVTGGSLGARNINYSFLKYIDKFLEKNIKIYFATGKENYEEIRDKIQKLDLENDNLIVKPYFDNMSEIMKKSKLLVCRAGAITISEIIELNKPAIFIPYNFVGQNENADLLVEKGYYKYSNEDVDKAFLKALEIIYYEEILMNMKKNVKELNYGNATKIITNEVLGDLSGNKE